MADALHTPGVTSAAEARLDDAGLIAVQGPTALDARTGVLWGPGTTTLVTGTADTAPMAYLIAPHHWVTNRGVNTDGVYRGALEAAQRVTTGAAPASGSRIDVVYEKQGDASSTITPDGSTAPVYGCVQGNPTTGTPVKPSIPVGAIELATATVAAGATATNGAGVTIANTVRQAVARGAAVPVRTQTERDALTTFPGLEVVRLDATDLRHERHDGTRWRLPEPLLIATMAARPTTGLYTGMRVRPLDTPQLVFVYTGSYWVQEGVYLPSGGYPNASSPPAGCYVRRVEAVGLATVANAGGGFNVTIDGGGFSAAPLSEAMWPGSNTGSLGIVVPNAASHTATTLNGAAYQPNGTPVTNGAAIRVAYYATGWNT